VRGTRRIRGWSQKHNLGPRKKNKVQVETKRKYHVEEPELRRRNDWAGRIIRAVKGSRDSERSESSQGSGKAGDNRKHRSNAPAAT